MANIFSSSAHFIASAWLFIRGLAGDGSTGSSSSDCSVSPSVVPFLLDSPLVTHALIPGEVLQWLVHPDPLWRSLPGLGAPPDVAG